MKKEWTAPLLEVLDVNMTMGHTQQMHTLDKQYEAGTTYNELTWS